MVRKQIDFACLLKKKLEERCSILLIEKLKCVLLDFIPNNFLSVSFSR